MLEICLWVCLPAWGGNGTCLYRRFLSFLLYIVSVTLLLSCRMPCRLAVKGDGGRDLAISLGAIRWMMVVLCHCCLTDGDDSSRWPGALLCRGLRARGGRAIFFISRSVTSMGAAILDWDGASVWPLAEGVFSSSSSFSPCFAISLFFRASSLSPLSPFSSPLSLSLSRVSPLPTASRLSPLPSSSLPYFPFAFFLFPFYLFPPFPLPLL